jgi:hypothetical protein
VFSKWKGRPYARALVTPKNPKSVAQVGIRAIMKFLTQQWKSGLTAPNKATWDELAAATNISPFNAYIAHNVSRWRNGAYPTKAYPAALASTELTIVQVLDGGIRHMDVENTPSGATAAWGIAIYRDAAAITTALWNNCVAVIAAAGAAAVNYVDAPLVAGTYHYRSRVLMTDGKPTIACADASEPVT